MKKGFATVAFCNVMNIRGGRSGLISEVHVPILVLYNKNFFTITTNRRTNFQIYSGTKLYMFRAVSLPILRSYPLYIMHWHML